MTANRGLFVRNNGTVGTTPIEGRLVMASLVAENAPGTPRNGLLDQRATTVVSGTANMNYSVGPCTVVVNRAAGEGVYIFTLTGTTTVATTAAPGTGSRWDLIYVKQNDLDKGDATNTATLAVLQGTASTGTPTKPTASLPAGAYVLAEAQVSAGATATNGAQVAISQTWRYTALRGAPIPVRNVTERGEITASVFTAVRRLDLGNLAIETYDGANWKLSLARQYAEFTSSFNVAGGGVNWDLGPMTKDLASSTNHAFVDSTGALSGAIIFREAGVYSINSYSAPNTSGGTWAVFQNLNGGGIMTSGTTTGYAWEVSTSTTALIPAGAYVRFTCAATNGMTPVNTRLRVAKISD